MSEVAIKKAEPKPAPAPALAPAAVDFSLDRITDSFANTQRVARLFGESGLFQAVGVDPSKSMAMCAVKIMMGRDMGLSPTQAMTGIHIIEGRPVASSLIQTTFLRKAVTPDGKQRFRYTVEKLTSEICDATLYERIDGEWQQTGVVHVDIKDCPTQGKDKMKTNWKNHPDDMLFKTAISKLIRRFAPEVLGGVPPDVEIEANEEPQRVVVNREFNVSALPAVEDEIQDAAYSEPSAPVASAASPEQTASSCTPEEEDELVRRMNDLAL